VPAQVRPKCYGCSRPSEPTHLVRSLSGGGGSRALANTHIFARRPAVCALCVSLLSTLYVRLHMTDVDPFFFVATEDNSQYRSGNVDRANPAPVLRRPQVLQVWRRFASRGVIARRISVLDLLATLGKRMGRLRRWTTTIFSHRDRRYLSVEDQESRRLASGRSLRAVREARQAEWPEAMATAGVALA